VRSRYPRQLSVTCRMAGNVRPRRTISGPGLVYPAGKAVLSRTASGGYVMLC